MQGYHKSVLLKEALEALNIRDAYWYLDCTLGDGGHSIEIIKRGGRVVAFDVDPQALGRAQKRFEEQGIDQSKFRLVQGNFRDIENLIKQADTADQEFKGVIFDLGVSSLQLETPERGFSFGKNGPLDMRMDPSLSIQALDLVNNLSRKELNELFFSLGEEKYSWRLADVMVSSRQVKPFTSTVELADVITKTLGGVRGKIHPATKVFQALRMMVNDELGALQEGLDQVREVIKRDGRIVVISFHSLEDRIVKNTFKKWKLEGLGEILTEKPVLPTEEEIRENPRSRSAKMRVFKKG